MFKFGSSIIGERSTLALPLIAKWGSEAHMAMKVELAATMLAGPALEIEVVSLESLFLSSPRCQRLFLRWKRLGLIL